MLEAYAIGARLELTSNAGSVLDKLITDFERFNRLVKESSSALGQLGRKLRMDSGSLAGLDKLSNAMKAAESAGAGLTRSLKQNAEYASETARSMQAAAKAMESAGRVRGAGGSSGGGRGSSRFSEHNIMMGGLGAGLLGGVLLDAVKHTMTPAIDVNRTRDVLAADMRMTPAQVDAAMARARETTKLAPGTTIGENLASTVDLKTIFGSVDEAQKLLPEFARMTALFQVLDRRKGGSGEQAFAAGKALEIMGGMVDETTDAAGHTVRTIDPELGMKRLKAMERAAVATNMRVMPSDYLGMAKQARVAGMQLSDEFTFEKLPALMAVLGGPRTGTALMGMAQVFQGGKLTAKSMEALQGIGLAGPGGITHEGGQDVVHSNQIYDLDKMGHDPSAYMDAAQKRMEAAGVHGTEAQIVALMKASQRSTIAGFLADLLKDAPAIAKEQATNKAIRPDMAEHMAQVDPAAKVQQFEAALTNLATELGSAGMSDAMAILDKVTAGLNALAEWAHNNPGLARVAFDTAAGLGAVATALGALSTAILVLGPALKLLGIGGGGAAAGAAGTAAQGGALGLASRLLTNPWVIGGALAYGAVKGALMPTTSAGEAAKDQQRSRDLGAAARRDPNSSGFVPQDGYGDGSGGAAAQRMSYHPGNQNINIHLDGEVIYRSQQRYRDRDAQRPNSGPSLPDGRLNILYPLRDAA